MESSLENSFVFMQEAGQSTSSLESENHIQSLNQQSKKDLTPNNGKASFVLDDSYIHFNDASANSSITDPSSRSFVVLGKNSMDVIQPSSLASYVDIEQKSMSIDCNSVIASWNSNEVHDKLNELIRENEKLKETLKQNNMAMKQQFNSVASWQEEIMKIHQNHKKKFAETRELIECLKKENAELKSKITGGNDSLESAYEMPSINEMQSSKEKKSSISEVEFQEFLLGDNSQELKAQHAMSKSYNSNDLEQSIAHNTPEHAKVVDKCASCEQSLKVLKNSLKEVDFILGHRLQHTTAPVHVESPISFNKHSQPTIQQIQQWISKEIEACSMTKNTSELHTEDPQPRKSLDNCQKSQSLESSSPSNHGNLKTPKLGIKFQHFNQFFISKLHEMGVVPKEEIEEDIKKADVSTESLIDVTESIEKNVGDKHLQEQFSDLIKKTKNVEEEEQKIECRRENLEMEFMKLSAEKKKCEETINQLVTEVGTLHETIQKQESEIDKYQTKLRNHDCNSVIALWNSNEVHDTLNELIRENEKLKETLKQNNMAMKQQFNSVASWQEEIMKTHQNNKKKFAETRELIECLKKENAQLKSKITGGNDSLESAYEMPSINEMQSSKEKKSSISEVEFQEFLLGDNSQELKAQHAMSKSYNSNDLEQSIAHNTPEHAKAVDKCASCEQSLKVLKNSLKEVDFILGHRLQHTTAPVHVESPISYNKHSQPTIQQIQQWISKEIEACSMTKNTSELHTEDPQPRKSLDNCQKSQSLESSSPSNHGNLKTPKLGIKFQHFNQFFISKLHEMGVVPKEEIEEDIKKADVSTESLIDVTESIEKNVGDKHLQEQFSDLIKKTKNVEEEEQKIECRRENLEMEFMKLSAEKKKCEETINQLVTEVGTLHETIQKQESEIDKYQTKLRNHEESIKILQEQMTTYEKDFKLENGQKMILSEENSRLQDELQSQIEITQDLLSQITVLQLTHNNTCSSDA